MLIFFVVFLAFIAYNMLSVKKPVEVIAKFDCPPHKWTYHPITQRMTCVVCNYEAGK